MIEDVRLPEKWSKGSAGGPEFRTEIVGMVNGEETREQRWTFARQRYDIVHNVKSQADMAEINAFFRVRRGRRKGFLLKDWTDFTSAVDGASAPAATNQPLGTGDGAQTDFQLIKRYADTAGSYDRPILWPVTGSVLVAVDGTPTPSGWAVDRGTGIVSFDSAPANGAVLTAGFEFDVPVRFDDDWMSASWDSHGSRSVGSIPLIELLGE